MAWRWHRPRPSASRPTTDPRASTHGLGEDRASHQAHVVQHLWDPVRRRSEVGTAAHSVHGAQALEPFRCRRASAMPRRQSPAAHLPGRLQRRRSASPRPGGVSRRPRGQQAAGAEAEAFNGAEDLCCRENEAEERWRRGLPCARPENERGPPQEPDCFEHDCGQLTRRPKDRAFRERALDRRLASRHEQCI